MPWCAQASGVTDGLHAVWCDGDAAIAVGDRGTILERSAGRWVRQAVPTQENLRAVFGSNDGVLAVGGDLHVGGSSLVVRRDRAGWHPEPSGIQHILLAVTRGDFGWMAAGYNAGLVLGQPGSWTEGYAGHALHMFGLCVAGQRAYACGLSGSISVYDGDSWQLLQTGVSAHLRSICSPAPRMLFAVGLGGTIVRFDGQRWNVMPSPTRNALEGVWGDREDEVYAVGYTGTILRFDGHAWQTMDTDTDASLHGVHGTASEVVAVGARGTVLSHRRPS